MFVSLKTRKISWITLFLFILATCYSQNTQFEYTKAIADTSSINLFNLAVYYKDLLNDTDSTLPDIFSNTPMPIAGYITGQPTPRGVIPGYGRTIGLNMSLNY